MLLALGATNATAAEARTVTIDQLPKQAQAFIETHFAGEKISIAKVERDLFEVNYEVLLMNSAKLEFTGNGTWKEVDCRYQVVPEAIIPSAIVTSIRERYPEAKVLEINRDRRDYELKLSNGLELTYDLKYNLVDIDN